MHGLPNPYLLSSPPQKKFTDPCSSLSCAFYCGLGMTEHVPFFFFFWLCWVFVAARGLSLVAASGGYSLLWCAGFSLQWLLLLQSTGSRCTGFSSCVRWAQQLWRTGLVAPRHVGSSPTRDRTRVPCIGRWILNHCTTREVRACTFKQSGRPINNSFTCISPYERTILITLELISKTHG